MTNQTPANRDHEQLKLLSLLHYVVGGLTVAFSLIPVPHIAFGIFAINFPEIVEEEGELPPEFFGWFFVIIGVVIAVTILIMAITILVSGRAIAKRKAYWYSFVVACFECLLTPYGTALGVFTLIVLSRDSVKEIYKRRE